MTNEPTIWGIHMGAHVDNRPIDGCYVAIGWQELGNLMEIPVDREAFKAAIMEHIPNAKPGAVPVYAGTTFKFAHSIKAGDFVVYPSKTDRMVNIGRFTDKSEYVEGDSDEYPNRRGVEWLAHVPRSDISQSALNEIGSAVTLFRVKRHAAEFLAKAGIEGSLSADESSIADDDQTDDDTATLAASRQAEETTYDFITRRIMATLSGYQFEEFIAHLMECMGYTARVTARSGDGGVDVIAHMDALGFQPPIVKVQCKRITGQTPRPDVDQLLGTLGEGEYGLFVSLGSYSRGAVELERNRSKLRLINGDQLVELVLEHYPKLSPRYRSIIPLKQIFVPDLAET